MDAQIKTLIDTIIAEKNPGGNTRDRVGTVLNYINNLKADTVDTFNKTQVNAMINEVKALAVSGAQFLGTISDTTSLPAGDIWAFAEPGNYPGGITINPDELGILSRVNGNYSVSILASDVDTSIPHFNALPFPVSGRVQTIFNGGLYDLKDGQTATITDIPTSDVNSKWTSLGLTLNSTFRDYISPALEINGIALNTGMTTPASTRGRTVSFLDILYANQLELEGDMLMQAIFYYTDTNVFISREDINAKTFISTIPLDARKFKLSFKHTVDTQTVLQGELDALDLKCYAASDTSMSTVIESAMESQIVTNAYNSVALNLGYLVPQELGRINLTNGNDQSSTTGIRTNLIPVPTGSYTIIPKTGYKISRVVNYSLGSYVGFTSLPDFNIDNTSVTHVRLVFEKNVPTDTITAQEVIDFTYTLAPLSGNKLDMIYEEAKKIKPLPAVIYTQNEQLTILNTRETDINFDLTNRKIIIAGGSIIDPGNTATGRINLPLYPAGIDMPSSITAGVVLYNRSTGAVIVQNQTAAPLLNSYIMFTYIYSGAFNTFFVTGLKNYSVNGIPVSQKDTRQTNKFAISNFGIPYWSAPVQPAFDSSLLNSENLYELYRTIAGEIPTGVTETVIGQTDSPTPYDVLRYDISFNRKTPANQRRRKPKIFVCGGIHGGERLGVYTTYLFFKELLTNITDPIINMLRTNFDWTFIPLVNPYALNIGEVGGVESVRWNHNGVDINRNFDYRWAAYADGGIGSQSYKGTAPFSEKESQFVRDTFNSIKADTVLYLDCHNFGSDGLADPRCVWFASTFNTIQNIVYALCDTLDAEFKKRYAYLPKNQLLGFSDIDGASPMSQSWISDQQIIGVTIETDQSDYFNTVDPSNFNSNVMTRSLEAYVNSFYSLAKYAVEMYNNRI